MLIYLNKQILVIQFLQLFQKLGPIRKGSLLSKN